MASLTAPVQQEPRLTGKSLMYKLCGGPLIAVCNAAPSAGKLDSVTVSCCAAVAYKTCALAMPSLRAVNW